MCDGWIWFSSRWPPVEVLFLGSCTSKLRFLFEVLFSLYIHIYVCICMSMCRFAKLESQTGSRPELTESSTWIPLTGDHLVWSAGVPREATSRRRWVNSELEAFLGDRSRWWAYIISKKKINSMKANKSWCWRFVENKLESGRTEECIELPWITIRGCLCGVAFQVWLLVWA